MSNIHMNKKWRAEEGVFIKSRREMRLSFNPFFTRFAVVLLLLFPSTRPRFLSTLFRSRGFYFPAITSVYARQLYSTVLPLYLYLSRSAAFPYHSFAEQSVGVKGRKLGGLVRILRTRER